MELSFVFIAGAFLLYLDYYFIHVRREHTLCLCGQLSRCRVAKMFCCIHLLFIDSSISWLVLKTIDKSTQSLAGHNTHDYLSHVRCFQRNYYPPRGYYRWSGTTFGSIMRWVCMRLYPSITQNDPIYFHLRPKR